jgi:hypothetical protein
MSKFSEHSQPCKANCIPCAKQFGYREGIRKAASHLQKEIEEARLAHESSVFLESLLKRILGDLDGE